MTSKHEPEEHEGPAKKAVYYIVIEAHDVEDTEFQVQEVSELTEQIGRMLSFNGTVWLDNVEYEDGGQDA
jgi:hypothetical protein